VLYTERPPQRPTVLRDTSAPSSAASETRQFRFSAGCSIEQPPVCLGTLTCEGKQPPETPGEAAVQRGRGGQQQAERLLIVAPLDGETAEMPHVRLTGLLKAATRAALEAAGGQPGLIHWWLGCRLAQRGYLTRAHWKETWRRLGLQRPELGERIERVGPYLAWQEYLERRQAELLKALTRGKRNPLRTQLSTQDVVRLLNLPAPEIAARVLETFASAQHLSVERSAGELTVRLEGDLAPPPLSAEDAALVAQITGSYAAEAGTARAALAKLDPARQHVIHWLFDAGLLVEGPDGYVFTRGQLTDYRRRLGREGAELANVSIRELKDLLGLKRRAAEALFAYLHATYGGDSASGGSSR